MTFLDGLPRLLRRPFFRKPLSVFVFLLVLVSSFSFLATVVSDRSGLGEAPGVPARSSTITSSNLVVSPTTAYVGDVITFTANALSDTGTTLTYTFFYDNFLTYDPLTKKGTVNPTSPVSVNTTGNPSTVVTQWTYSAPGPIGGKYYVNVSINDNTGAPLKNITRPVTIRENSAPFMAPDLDEQTIIVEWGVPVDLSVTCWDVDNDDLTLTWDFGDGTDQAVNTTGPALAGIECTQTHAWNPDPSMWYGVGDTTIEYFLNLSLTDGQGHWSNTSALIHIPLDHNFSPRGNLSLSATTRVSTITVDPGDMVVLYSNASDAEGEPMRWTFIVTNSTGVLLHTEVHHTDAVTPGTRLYYNMSYVFSEPGSYAVALNITDLAYPELEADYPDHITVVPAVYISSVLNRPPDVMSTIEVVPQDVKVDEDTGIATALLSIQANDRDGEVLYVTWNFGDGSELAYNTSGGGTQVYTFNQVHEFLRPGQFNVSVVVTDGRIGHEISRYKLVNVTSNNSCPEVRAWRVVLSNSSYGVPGSVVQFTLVLFDLERDPLQVSWDFGDGSPLEWTNVSSFDASGNVTIRINHTYDRVGNYTILIYYTDGVYGRFGLNEDSWTGRVRISVPTVWVERQWDWWDYTSLSLLFIMVALLIVWAVMGSMKRNRLDMMGTTVEEYLLRKQEIQQFEDRHRVDEGGGGAQ